MVLPASNENADELEVMNNFYEDVKFNMDYTEAKLDGQTAGESLFYQRRKDCHLSLLCLSAIENMKCYVTLEF